MTEASAARPIYLSPPHMGERERALLLDAFDSNWIAPLGPHVNAFEQELAACVGVAHAAALSSGTAALHLGLILLGVQPGDEVIVPTLTFSATANAVRYCGAQPVFVDCTAQAWTLDPDLLREELQACARRGKLPRAVITVDLYGQCADFDAVQAVCADYGIPILEDAAEALGARYKNRSAGSLGELAVFSFNGNKIITTSGGGMLVSQRGDWIEQARYLASQARDAAPHYQHSQVGYNYRLSNLLAAVGRGQLQQLPERVALRQRNRAFYQAALAGVPGIRWMPQPAYTAGNAWLTCCILEPAIFGCHREAVRLHLQRLHIEARPLWKPLHLQPVFSACRVRGGQVAAGLFEHGLCLPSGSSLSLNDLQQVVAGMQAARQGAGPGGPHGH